MGFHSMATCDSCGFEKGEGRYCPKCGAMAGVVSSGTAQQTLGTQPMQSSQPLHTYAPSASQPMTGSSGVAKGFAIALMAMSVLAAISTFLPWLSGNGESANGWKMREALVDSDFFSAGPILVIVGSGVVLLVAIGLLSAASKDSSMNRVGLGLSLLIPGLMMAGGLGATYNDLSDYFGRDAISEILAIGWYVGALCGFGIALVGLLSFFIKPLSNSK